VNKVKQRTQPPIYFYTPAQNHPLPSFYATENKLTPTDRTPDDRTQDVEWMSRGGRPVYFFTSVCMHAKRLYPQNKWMKPMDRKICVVEGEGIDRV